MRMRFKPYAHDELMAADFHVHEPLIWGGKWHEYDLMHFEYRPEIMAKARVLHQLETAGGSGLEGLSGGAERDGGTVASPHDLSGVGAAGGSNG